MSTKPTNQKSRAKPRANDEKPKAAKKTPAKKAAAKPKAPADRSAAVAESWKNKDVAAARSTKHKVKVGGELYNSVHAAFSALKLPISKVIPFRMELKGSATGRATFKDEKKGNFQFTLVQSDAA